MNTSSLRDLVTSYQRVIAENESLETFLQVRSAIAAQLIEASNDKVGEWYTDDAFTVADEKYITSHDTTLPPLREAVFATLESYKVLQKVLAILDQPAIEAVCVSGSANWGRYYSLFYNEKKISDIDLDVIYSGALSQVQLDDFGLNDEIAAFERHQRDTTADMLMSKVYIQDIEVSLHFIPLDKVETILNYPYDTSKTPFHLTAYRSKLPHRDGAFIYGPTYDFIHTTYSYDMHPIKLTDGFTTRQPFMMLGDDGAFVIAMSLDKLLIVTLVLGQAKDKVDAQLKSVLAKIAQRKRAEDKQRGYEGSFVDLVARYPRMPLFIQKKIQDMDKL